MARKRNALPRKRAAAPMLEVSSGPDAIAHGEDYAVQYRGAKQHSPGSWLRQNWSNIAGLALRITSLRTGKEIFWRLADAIDR